jgi:hypothetical protein
MNQIPPLDLGLSFVEPIVVADAVIKENASLKFTSSSIFIYIAAPINNKITNIAKIRIINDTDLIYYTYPIILRIVPIDNDPIDNELIFVIQSRYRRVRRRHLLLCAYFFWVYRQALWVYRQALWVYRQCLFY